jgi:hypothetical protein
MRLNLILPEVDPEQFEEPDHCVDPKCKGRPFLLWQEVRKNVRDSEYAVALMLEAMGVYLSKSSVYRAVQATAEAVPGMKRTEILKGYQTRALGADLTSVKCKGQWLPMGVVVDPINGLVLTIDHLEGEDAQTLQEWMEPIADQAGAHTLVTDEAGLDHQVCKSHVVRNTEELIASLSAGFFLGGIADRTVSSPGRSASVRRVDSFSTAGAAIRSPRLV